MPHSSAFRTTTKRYVAIPSSFFAHASPASMQSSLAKPPLTPEQPQQPPPTKICFASQQAARLAQQRVAKQKEAMLRGTYPSTGPSTRLSWTGSSSSGSSSSTRSSTSSSCSSTSTTRRYSPSFSSSSLGSQVISQTIETLRNMESRLDDLLSKFQIPGHLDFISTHLDSKYSYYHSRNGPLTHLSITLRNRPVIALGELLNSLEQELGLVEANGNNYMELHKQNVANRVKEIAVDLEKRVHDLWWTALCEKASTAQKLSLPTMTALPIS